MKISNFQFSISRNGFTLMEFLVIIGIIGILVLIGIPTFRNIQPNLQLSGVTRELITDLRYAQQLTVTEQVEHGVLFDSAQKKYQVIKHGEGTEDTVLKEKSLPREIKTLTITGLTNNNEARFNPYGAVKEIGTITLININEEMKIIDVRPSGFVRISD